MFKVFNVLRWFDWLFLALLLVGIWTRIENGEYVTAWWMVVASVYYLLWTWTDWKYRALGVMVLGYHEAFNKQTRELQEARDANRTA